MSPRATRPHTSLLASIAAATLLLGACGDRDEARTVGQQVDTAIANAGQKTEAATSGMRDATRAATAELRQSASNAANAVADKVQDAAITATVNAALAKDSALSALKIDVDTVNGRVSLRGTAPSEDARQRATRLASNVKGVVDVQNNLEVRS